MCPSLSGAVGGRGDGISALKELVIKGEGARLPHAKHSEGKVEADGDDAGCSNSELGERPVAKEGGRRKVMVKGPRGRI